MDIEKLNPDAHPESLDEPALVYDHARLHYMAHRIEGGADYEGWTLEGVQVLHDKLDAELSRRGIPHVGPLGQWAKNMAFVHPSGVVRGPEITLAQVLPHLKPFKVRAPFAWIVGGLAIHGRTAGDIDILIRAGVDELSPEMAKVVTWRILRALPPELAQRVEFHFDDFHGPFTDAVPLYDLALVAPGDGNTLRMDGLQEPSARLDLFAALTGEIDAVSKAETTDAEGETMPAIVGRTAKPVMGAGPEERLTPESTVREVLAAGKGPWLVQHKYDGVSLVVRRDKSGVRIWTEDGQEVTRKDMLGHLAEDIAAQGGGTPYTLVAELEAWRGREHLPRETIAGMLTAGVEPPHGVRLTASVHDCLELDGGDLTGQGTAFRLDAAAKVKSSGKDWPLVESLRAANRQELLAAIRKASALPGSEGAVVKPADLSYPFRGTAGWFKYRKNEIAICIVVRAEETKVKGTYVYHIGLVPSPEFPAPKSEVVSVNGRKLLYVGRTFSSARKLAPGLAVPIEFSQGGLNRLEDGTFTFTMVLPRILDPKDWPRAANSVAEVVALARRTGLLIERSPEGVREVRKGIDPFQNPPAEGKPYPYVVQGHWRGKGVHHDLRIGYDRGETLLGWTIATQIRGAIDKPVDTIEQAQKLRFADYSKIDWKTGEWAKRKKGKAEVYAELYANRKALEPWAWLNVEGSVEAGEVGATRNYPGIFQIVDDGECEYGAAKPWACEYFFSGGKLPRRLVFRQLKAGILFSSNALTTLVADPLIPEEMLPADQDEDDECEEDKRLVVPAEEGAFAPDEPVWLCIRPLDFTPYVLSRRAINDGWIPPQGYSALPAQIRRAVPESMRYWEHKEEAKRIQVRDALAEEWDPVKLTWKASARFAWQYQTFRTPHEKPIREGATSWQWDLRLDRGSGPLLRLRMTEDISANERVSAQIEDETDRSRIDLEGEIPADSELNPAPETSSQIVILDKGEARFLVDRPDTVKVELRGKRLKGVLLAMKRATEWEARWVERGPKAD